MYKRLDSIPACDRQTDVRTDRQTYILPRHSARYAYASRGKNSQTSDGDGSAVIRIFAQAFTFRFDTVVVADTVVILNT